MPLQLIKEKLKYNYIKLKYTVNYLYTKHILTSQCFTHCFAPEKKFPTSETTLKSSCKFIVYFELFIYCLTAIFWGIIYLFRVLREICCRIYLEV